MAISICAASTKDKPLRRLTLEGPEYRPNRRDLNPHNRLTIRLLHPERRPITVFPITTSQLRSGQVVQKSPSTLPNPQRHWSLRQRRYTTIESVRPQDDRKLTGIDSLTALGTFGLQLAKAFTHT